MPYAIIQRRFPPSLPKTLRYHWQAVLCRKDRSFILDDGTGKVEVFFDGSISAKLVRAFCSVSEGRLNADSIQSMDGLDLNLFKKVEDLYSRYYV